jgi:hypothetical protein
MQRVTQSLTDILASLQPLTVDWKDPVAVRVIDKLTALPVRSVYALEDIGQYLDADFDDGLLICRLFLGLSKDQFTSSFIEALGEEGSGKTRFK